MATTPLTVPQASQMFRLLGDENRLRILLHLARHGEMHVTSLCELTGQSQPATSHHLTLLRMAGLITFRRAAKNNFYRLSSDQVRVLLRAVKF